MLYLRRIPDHMCNIFTTDVRADRTDVIKTLHKQKQNAKIILNYQSINLIRG